MKFKIVLASLLALAGLAHAELIPGLTIESATVGLNGEMGPEKAINGFGLEGDVPSLTASHRQGFNTNWWTGWSGEITDWQLTIDLEDNYKLDAIHIWNYREGCCTGRGLSEIDIYVASDENEDNLVKLETDGTGEHDGENGGFLLPVAPVGGDYFGFDLDVSGVTNPELLNNVRLFRIDGGSTNHNGGADWGGLGEIQFDGSPAVEKPSTLQLNIASDEEGLDFSWMSTEGKLYDLVSSTDLSIPIDQWPVYEENEDIPAELPMNTLSAVPANGPKRFFAIIEK